MKMKRLLAVLLALTVFVGLMPAMDMSVKAAATYTLSGVPKNVDISVDGVVQVPADGAISVEAGATVNVAPAKEYEIKELEVQMFTPPEDDTVFVTLEADDVWGDGSGYQMLLDSDANAYGYVIPTSGGLTSSGDASEEVYAEFEYKIPENADGSLTTENILIAQSATIVVKPGYYDYAITNPTPGDRMWIASANGNVPGRGDDFLFESGHSYLFYVSYDSDVKQDRVDFTDTYRGTYGDYISVTANEDGSFSFVMPESDALMKASVSQIKDGYFYDFEDDEQFADWLVYDADGDGYGWYLDDELEGIAPSGSRALFSLSYYNATALTSDNWLILDKREIPANAELSFWLMNYLDSWRDTIEVYVGEELDTTDPEAGENALKRAFIQKRAEKISEPVKSKPVVGKKGAMRALQDNMTQVGEDYYAPGKSFEEFTIDLSEFSGQELYIAFRHNSTDMYRIYIDDVWLHGDEEEPSGELEPVADDLADGNIKLTWDAVEGATAYNVYDITGGGENYLGFTMNPVFVDDNNHLMGETYSFRVVALSDSSDPICEGSVDDLFNPFVDVEDDRPTFGAIAWAYNNEIVKGSLGDDGFRYFEPEGSTTRMNFVMILWKMHGSPTVKGKNPFKDVTGKKSIAAVLWAYKKGLVKGTDKKHFSPDMNLSRMNIIMILYKLAGSPAATGENPFEDVSGSKSVKAVLWAVQNGLISGVDETHFAPDGDCSRELFVDVLCKFNEIYKIM